MDTSQIQLNKRLLESIEAHDFEQTRNLLSQGADPLGRIDEKHYGEYLLGELFCEAVYDEKLAKRLPALLELFYNFGMDIATKNIPDKYDDDNPLWCLSFVTKESGLEALKVLLDHQLDHHSAEALVAHILLDMEMCDGDEVDENTYYGLKMVMFTASYPHIISKSTFIANCIALDKNHGEMLLGFRDWNKWTYHIDKSTCDHIPYGLRNATLTIKDKETDKTVWTLLI